jgi:DNA-binding protein YbaB
MFGDLMARMEGAKAEVAEKLKSLVITKTDLNGWVKVDLGGDRQIRDISIADELVEKGEAGLIEDLLTNVLNEAMAEAAIREKEIMEEMAGKMMPGGLGGLKGLFG